MIFAFLEDMAIATLLTLGIGAVVYFSREIWWGIDWLTDQVKRRWRDR